MREKIITLCLILFLISGCSTEKAHENNHVQVRSIKDVETLNPISYGGQVESRVIFDLIYQSLLTIDLENNEIKPNLAEALPEVINQDSISFFSYTLRKEALWPNGEPVTAQDVLFSLKVANCPLVNNENPRMNLDFIQNIKVDSTSHISFVLQCEGYGEDMHLTTGDFYILPEYKYDPEGLLKTFSLMELKNGYETLKNDPQIQVFSNKFNELASSHAADAYVGSGGYELAAWQTDQYISLKKKEGWWAEELNIPYITANPDQITFQIIPDDAAAVMALKNGQLDVMGGIPVNEFKALAKDSSFLEQYNLFTPFTYKVNFIGINGRLPKFQSKKTRKAIAHLLNVEGIIKAIGQTSKSRSNGLISSYDARNYNNNIQSYDYDLERAKKLLMEDGWTYENSGWFKNIEGKKEWLSGSIQYKAGNYDYETTALVFKQAAEKVGIPIEVIPVENSVLSGNLKQHNFEFYIRGLIGNPFAFNFTPILHTQSAVINGMNYTAFGTTVSDSLIESIISTPDKEQQAQRIKAFQEILHDEANLLFLYFDEQKLAIHNRFENLKISGLYPNYEISAFKLKESY